MSPARFWFWAMPWAVATGLALGVLVVVVALLWKVKLPQRAVCDEAVQTMLTTRDQIELERAMFLIDRLDCSVGRRLPAPPL